MAVMLGGLEGEGAQRTTFTRLEGRVLETDWREHVWAELGFRLFVNICLIPHCTHLQTFRAGIRSL